MRLVNLVVIGEGGSAIIALVLQLAREAGRHFRDRRRTLTHPPVFAGEDFASFFIPDIPAGSCPLAPERKWFASLRKGRKAIARRVGHLECCRLTTFVQRNMRDRFCVGVGAQKWIWCFRRTAIEPSKRYAAWQGAICDVYVHVDVESDKRSDYQGFIREARFGAVTMTDVLLSEQRISRRERHIAKLDKDCYYVEFVQHGKINILQSGQSLLSNAGVGAIFSASEAYDLECVGKVRSLYLEIPRQEFAEQFPKGSDSAGKDHGNRPGAGPDRLGVLLDARVGGSASRCAGEGSPGR